jgi:hypothetical protein
MKRGNRMRKKDESLSKSNKQKPWLKSEKRRKKNVKNNN